MKKLKLNNLTSQNLNKKEMNELRGGGAVGDCCCACRYYNQGGSSSDDNGCANFDGGKKSKECPNTSVLIKK